MTESTERIDGISGEPNTSTSLESISPYFLYLFFYSHMWKGSHESLIIYLCTKIYFLNLHILHIKMNINRDGMGPFTPISQYPSLEIALNFSCADNIRAYPNSQLFFSNMIRITPPH
jgi:hypothetical protein